MRKLASLLKRVAFDYFLIALGEMISLVVSSFVVVDDGFHRNNSNGLWLIWNIYSCFLPISLALPFVQGLAFSRSVITGFLMLMQLGFSLALVHQGFRLTEVLALGLIEFPSVAALLFAAELNVKLFDLDA